MVISFFLPKLEAQIGEQRIHDFHIKDRIPCENPHEQKADIHGDDQLVPLLDFSDQTNEIGEGVGHVVQKQNRNSKQELPVNQAVDHQHNGDVVVQEHHVETH